MEQVRDLAIVLRSIPYAERHRIVTALTENFGLVSGIARNAIQSRRFGGCLEVFAASEWTFVAKPGAELVRVDEAKIRRSFEGLRKDFAKLSLASAFSELMIKVAPRMEPCPDLFRLHSNALALVEESAEAELSLLNAYLAKLLQWNGTQPRLATCLGCERPLLEEATSESVSCVVASPGWVCASCRVSRTEHIQVGEGLQHTLLRAAPLALRDFQLGLVLPLRQAAAEFQASREQHRELFRFLEALLAFHVPGFDQQPLKSLRFLDVESNLRPRQAGPRSPALRPL